MASLTIRNLDENVKKALRIRAAARGVSMEEEARQALEKSVSMQAERQKMPAAEAKAAAKALMEKLANMPRGEPIDPRYATLDHKTLTDMIWDGEL